MKTTKQNQNKKPTTLKQTTETHNASVQERTNQTAFSISQLNYYSLTVLGPRLQPEIKCLKSLHTLIFLIYRHFQSALGTPTSKSPLMCIVQDFVLSAGEVKTYFCPIFISRWSKK